MNCMEGGKSATSLKQSAILAGLATFFFVVLACQWSFVLTMPSDPLEYVAPALHPEQSFPYLDRIVLWLWIRLVAMFPMPLEIIGPVSTLIVTATMLFIATWWLERIQPLAGSIFAAVYITSPMILGIATYTYPMQLMTLVLLLSLISMDFLQWKNSRHLIGGVGCGIASLCKIQGGAFFGFLLIDVFVRKDRRLTNLVSACCGIVIGISIIFMIVVITDGPFQLITVFKQYFQADTLNAQWYGRQLGNLPPFYKYLFEPTCVIACAGILLPWADTKLFRFRPFAATAAVQFVFLLGIYVITQRGGLIIHNYSIDTFVFGVIAFAGSVAIIFKSERLSFWKQILIGFSLISCSFLIVEYFGYFSKEVAVYKPHRISLNFSVILAIVAAWVSVFVIFGMQRLTLKKKKLHLSIFFVSLLLALSVSIRAGEGVKDGKFRKQWSAPYHIIGRQVTRLKDYSTWVCVKENHKTISEGSLAAKQIFDAFYFRENNKKRINVKLVFGADDPISFRFLITDQAYLINKYSNLQIKTVKDKFRNGYLIAVVDRVTGSVNFLPSES
ncbi:hypothetical protein C4565_08255 [Candidatus Parcubacteria bacterium]|nr:MAG: hypothetical protein C4565_08255 [Candidatus Parcubacteria bacterium]